MADTTITIDVDGTAYEIPAKKVKLLQQVHSSAQPVVSAPGEELVQWVESFTADIGDTVTVSVGHARKLINLGYAEEAP